MNNELYAKLRKHLDRQPGGFPETQSGAEIDILKRFYTPEQAKITLKVTSLPEPAVAIAKRLKADVLNKAQAGTCFMEKAIVDYLAREDYDFILLELGINVREVFSEEEFKNRANYLIKTVLEKYPHKHIFLISIFMNYANFPKQANSLAVNKVQRHE